MNVHDNPQAKARYGVDPYLDWLAGEGIPVTEDYGVYLFGVETRPWPRYGVNGAAVQIRRLRVGDKVGVGRSLLLFGSNEEIAARLGCVISTVERKLARIRGKWASEMRD